MLSLTLSRNSDQPLADQIVTGIKRQIDDRHLLPGTKLPSISNFAESYKLGTSMPRMMARWTRNFVSKMTSSHSACKLPIRIHPHQQLLRASGGSRTAPR